MLTEEVVRTLLLQSWGRQTCQNQNHWLAVQQRLFSDAKSVDGAPVRASFRPRFDQAVTALTATLAVSTNVDEIYWAIFYAFPPLDQAHRQELARELIAAATPGLFDDV